jgi:ADP-heptose:LPS heptosyltransferase
MMLRPSEKTSPMNLDLIRAIDKWVGIPACFFVSLGHWILSRLGQGEPCGRGEDTTPEKILFIELSEMGSAILAFSAIRYAMGKYPGVQLYFLIFEQNRFSVDILDTVPPAHVITIDVRSAPRFIYTTLQAIRAIRKAGIDTVLDLELFSRFSSLLGGVTGACRRVGYGRYHEEGLYRGGFMTHRVFYNCHQHMARNFMALVKAIERPGEHPLLKEAIDEKDLVPARYESSEEDLRALRARLVGINPAVGEAEHLILFNPHAGNLLPVRAWPAENYGALAQTILQQYNAVIIIIGLEQAREEAAKILDQVGSSRCIDFTGQTSFKDLMDLLSLAHVLVTSDSGPAHFASLTPIKNIVLFGPETPLLYGPLGQNASCLFAGLACSPCLSAYNHRKTSCTDPKCMKAITVDEVFGAVAGSLGDLEGLN